MVSSAPALYLFCTWYICTYRVRVRIRFFNEEKKGRRGAESACPPQDRDDSGVTSDNSFSLSSSSLF